MDKRFVIAIALVFLILFVWPLLFGTKNGTRPKDINRDINARTQQPKKEEPKEKQEDITTELEIPAQESEETLISIRTPLYEIQMTTEGARAVSWKMKEYFRRSKKLDFSIPLKYKEDLGKGRISNGLRQEFENEHLRQRFKNNNISLSQYSTVLTKKIGRDWLITDEDNGQTYSVKLLEVKNKRTRQVLTTLKVIYELDHPENIDLIPLDIRRQDRKWLAMKFHDPEIQDEMEDVQWTPSKELVDVQGVENAQDSMEFSYITSTGMRISKKMTFSRDSYVVDIDIAFLNQSSERMTLGGYKLYWGAGIALDDMISEMEVAKEGPMALVRTEDGLKIERHWHKTGFACFGGKHVRVPEKDTPISWVAFAGKYFVAALIPVSDETWWSDTATIGKRYAMVTTLEDAALPAALSPQEVWSKWGQSTAVALVQPEFSVAPGETVSHTFRVYVGPKKWDLLRNVIGRDGATEPLGLGKMIHFGMFSPLGKATLWLLKMFYRITNNYGVSLILLTVLIKIVYFPLNQKSFKSMNKMKGLQPKITALKEKHRDDPQRLQKETMKLYKQHKVNPMGGCLPMLLQMPVFFALFATLKGAVELRGATFIPGWITDLSLPDTITSIGGFPINILPVLMTGTTLLQQRFQGNPGQGQNNKMMAFMPLIFLFIFYGMPSGLVLYWLCNNILAIGHQYLLKRQEETETETEDQPEEKGKKNPAIVIKPKS